MRRTWAGAQQLPGMPRTLNPRPCTAQILPRALTDERTYNMLVSVCVRGRDLTQALHAADMLKTSGRRLDTILYTNLIGGARPAPLLPHGPVGLQPAARHWQTHREEHLQEFWPVTAAQQQALCMAYRATRSASLEARPAVGAGAVCASVGDADAAFQLYAAMKAEGVKTEPQARAGLGFRV